MQIQTNEELLLSFPIWEEKVWNALQKKDFPLAEENLKETLSYFTDEGVSKILWDRIISGIPMIRGDLTLDEWENSVLPIIASIFLSVGTGGGASRIYESLSFNDALSFHNLIVKIIPEETPQKKHEFLRLWGSSLYIYYTATPAQIFGFGILDLSEKINTNIPQDKERLYKRSLEIIKKQLFSYENANELFLLGKSKNLTDEKISGLSCLVGLVLTGILSLDDLNKKIIDVLVINGSEADFFTNKIRERNLLFQKDILIANGVKNTTISLESFSDTGPESFAPVKISVGGVADETSKKIEVTDQPAPLMIHREKPQTPTQGSGSSQQTKGFSLPFGFFKQKVVQTQASSTPVRATIEFLKKDELKRAVDYSELRTPLTPFSKKEGGFIKTEQQKIQNNPPEADKQPLMQKINPLTMFGGSAINNTGQIAKEGVLDIRAGIFNNQQPTIPTPRGSGLRPQSASEQTLGVLPEIKKQPIIDVQKNIPPPTPIPQTPPPSKSFSVPEKPKTPTAPVTNNIQKQNIPTEQKKEPAVTPTSGKGFVWFRKPAQKTITMTNDNNQKAIEPGPKVEGNTIDLSP